MKKTIESICRGIKSSNLYILSDDCMYCIEITEDLKTTPLIHPKPSYPLKIYSKTLYQLPSGDFLLQQNGDQEDIYYLNKEWTTFNRLNSEGDVYCIAGYRENKFVVGKSSVLQILDANQSGAIALMSKSFPPRCSGLLYLESKDLFISGHLDGQLRIWDNRLQQFQAINLPWRNEGIQLLFAQSEELQSDTIKIAAISKIGRRLAFLSFQDKNFTIVQELSGSLRNVQAIIGIDEEHQALLSIKGNFIRGTIEFVQSIEIWNFKDDRYLQCIGINQQQYVVEPHLITCPQPGEIIFVQKGKSEQLDSEILCQWHYDDQTLPLNRKSLALEAHQEKFMFKTGHLIVPFCLSFTIGDTYVKGASGVSVYDFSPRLIWQRQWQRDFLLKVLDVQSKDCAVFVGPKSIIEFWDMTNNNLLRSVDARPSEITFLKCLGDYLLLKNSKDELLIWESESLQPISRIKLNFSCRKANILNDYIIVLDMTGQVWRIEINKGQPEKIKVDWTVQDFSVQQRSLLLVGEDAMRLLSIEAVLMETTSNS